MGDPIPQEKTLFVLGGTGFIGSELVGQALASGWTVRGLARSDSSRTQLGAAGAQPVAGDAADPRPWADAARGSRVLLDLVQPPFPRRLGARAVARISDQRQATTRGVLEALGSIPAAERPLLISVSGADDLEPDAHGVVDHASKPRAEPVGFARIGLPVRALIAESGIEAAYVHFGVLVYGAGKVFADVYVKGMRRRQAFILGDGRNRMALTHVSDAAGALLHLACMPRVELRGRTFVAADGSDTTQRELLEDTARLMGAPRPWALPARVASLVGGGPAVESITLDLHADPSALVESGFAFRYPSHREGVREALGKLGELEAQ